METERKVCHEIFQKLKDSTAKSSALHEDYRVCLEAMQDILITLERRQAQYLLASKPKYRIVHQKYQYTTWDKWSREEQIAHSIGIEEDDALTGNCSIPKYCVLTLKKE